MKTKLLVLTSFLSGLLLLPALGQVPGILSHQGKITVSGTNYTGTGQFKFALVNAAGDTTFWSNDGTSTGAAEPAAALSLEIARGVFSVNLGDTTLANMTQAIPASAFTNSAVYLRTWFNDGVDGSQLLSPDRQIASVGYAFQAGSAAAYNETDPLFAASLASGITPGQTNNWDAAFNWGNHADAGYLSIESDPVFNASAASGIQGTDINGWNAKIDGAGTTGAVPAFTASGTIGNSAIVQSSGNIGIGTNTPAQTLSVNGTVQSATGGFMFPDGTVQTTAAGNGAAASAVLVEAFLSTDAPLTPGDSTQIYFDNAVINAGGDLSGVSFYVPSTGIYNIQFTVVSPSTVDHVKQAFIEDNGIVLFQGPAVGGSLAFPNSYVAPLTFTGPLSAGDAITFYTTMNSAFGVVASSGPTLANTSLVIVKLP